MERDIIFQEDRIDLARMRDLRELEREVEANWALRIRERDQSAMAELYERYGTLTFTIIFRIVGDRSIAEDLTQEAFMRVWTAIVRFDAERGALRTWLVTIARNKAIDYLRSANAQMDRLGCELDEFVAPKAAVAEVIENNLARQETLRLLNEALEHLTERQREVIWLAYFEGKTQVEIAQALRAPLGSVKTWVRSGLKRMRELMDQKSEGTRFLVAKLGEMSA